jgi:hypothetical protein
MRVMMMRNRKCIKSADADATSSHEVPDTKRREIPLRHCHSCLSSSASAGRDSRRLASPA